MKLIYTVNIGGYDSIKPPKVITPGWDYVYVTDSPKLNTGWNIMVLKRGPSPFLTSRLPKIKVNEFFPEYDLSIYIDSSMEINVDLNEFIKGKMSKSADMAVLQHHERYCIYDEIKACVACGKITKEKASEIEKKYKSEKIPKHGGMTANRVLIRKHNRKNLDLFNKLWFEETKFTLRDQLSFIYTYYKTRLISFDLFSNDEIKNKLIIKPHGI